MNLHWIDWLIVFGLLIFISVVAYSLKRYTRSVADFLAANRCAGRYLLCNGQAIAWTGAITILAAWQMTYEGGISASWWSILSVLSGMVAAVTGFCVYRYRQTRALTMAQFFEIRYNRPFRLFSGALAFFCGIVWFGLFPAVGAKFFIYFCGLPETVTIIGFEVSTFVAMMIFLLTISMMFTWFGGQIAVIITDFSQYFFCNVTFVAIVAFMLWKMDWSAVTETLLAAPQGQSPIHPFKGGNIGDFTVWFFIINAIAYFYDTLSNPIAQAYNSSAASAHEAKMAKILEQIRCFGMTLFWMVVPMAAYGLLRHVNYESFAAGVNETISTISNEAVRRQMTVPIVMTKFLPIGLRGALCASMLAAFISTHDTALHCFGSIFLQDIVMPLRKKPFAPKQHMLYLRLSILGVAIFVFFFSLIFRQTQSIFMYFALTLSIYVGGAGAAIIGGLYWKKGTTAAAFTALILGAVFAITGCVMEQLWLTLFDKPFPINGQYVRAIGMIAAVGGYIIISLIQNKDFNMDRMLHRGKYADDKTIEQTPQDQLNTDRPGLFKRLLIKIGVSKEFTRWDKIILIISVSISMAYIIIFIIGTIYNFVVDVPDTGWIKYWTCFVCVAFVLSIISTVWLSIGGWIDVKKMLKQLSILKRDSRDDGMVLDHHNRDED